MDHNNNRSNKNKWRWPAGVFLLLALAIGCFLFFRTNPDNTFSPDETPHPILDESSPVISPAPSPTESVLRLLSNFPADSGKNVPVTTGIEFTFDNTNVTLENVQSAFTIKPEAKGRFTYGNGRFVFFPTEKLEYETTYTITLSPPLRVSDGAALAEAEAFSFTTATEQKAQNGGSFQLTGNGATYNSLSSETPIIDLYINWGSSPGAPVSVTLYEFGGWEDYFQQLRLVSEKPQYTYYETAIYTEGLAKFAEFEVEPFLNNDNNYGYGLYMVQFPETLPEGWYAAEFTIDFGDGPVTRQLFLQISDLSVFYTVLDTNALAWINDAATGNPVDNASIRISGAYEADGVTGADGVALIENGQYMYPSSDNEFYAYDGGIITVSAGERHFVDIKAFSSYSFTGYNTNKDARKYMSYIYCDRAVYSTTDTVRVWGVVRPRDAATPMPDSLTLSFAKGMAQTEVTPGADGSFTAELSYESMAAGNWIELQLLMDDNIMARQSVSVYDFVKPIYTAETNPSAPVYMLDKSDSRPTGELSLEVSTFDGTPASSLGIAFSQSYNRISAAIEGFSSDNAVLYGLLTDSQGRLTLPMLITNDVDTWYPQRYGYRFSTSGAQSEIFSVEGRVYAIHRDLMLRSASVSDGDSLILQVMTNAVDISGIQNSDDLFKKDALKGDALDVEITANLHRIYFERQEIGTHYDYINRKTVTSYHFSRQDEIVDTYSFTTSGGIYEMRGLPLSDNMSCYFVELTAQDSKGRTVVTKSYLGSAYALSGGNDTGNARYGFNKVVDPMSADLYEEAYGSDDGYYYGSNYWVQRRFEDDEDVTFIFEKNDKPMDTLSGRILYSVVQDSFSHINVTDSLEITIPYAESLLPNYLLTGAYFDGKHIYTLDDRYMDYNPRQRELDIELDADSISYGPADTVQVNAAVTNKLTGKPAAGASVLLSVVDEAIFALQEQSLDILDRLYASVYYNYMTKYKSYTQNEYTGAAEKGGGGGDVIVRSVFEDTTFFSTASTGSNGIASFSFKLPDNITSWRLSSLALTDNNHAGSKKTNVSATLPFFIMPVASDSILAGDSFSVGLRGAGTGVNDSDPVSYTVTVTGEGVDETREAASTLKMYTSVRFDGLPLGEYTVTIIAECGEYADGISLPFSVIPSGVEVSLVKSFEIKDGIEIEPLRYPVTIAFYDKEQRTYNKILNNIIYSRGGRVDSLLAKKFGALLFRRQGIELFDLPAINESIVNLTSGRLVALLPYSTRDVELSVKAYMAVPEYFDSEYFLRELTKIVEGSYTGAKSALYLAQALVGEPLSADLAKLIETDGGLDYIDKMYLSLALAVTGDTEAATSYYNELVLPNLTWLTGISGEKAAYVQGVDDNRSIYDRTAAASILATVLGTNEAESLVRFLMEKKSPYEPYILEQLLYLSRFKQTDAKSSFSYKYNGKTITEELGSGVIYRTFTKDQLQNASFKSLLGDVYADVYYTGTPDQTSDTSQKLIGLTKTVEPVDGDILMPGSLVKVTLTPDLSVLDLDIGSTMMVIDDYIPSGMRFEKYDYQSNPVGWYMNSREGQRVQFTAYGAGSLRGLEPIIYYARCAAPGDYVIESAYISGGSSDIWGASERAMVSIK